MTSARTVLVPEDSPGFYHCVSRCVRRAFLCGVDHYSGRSFEHRKIWVEQRIVELASIFAVSVYGYAIMSNHTHVVVRVDPEAVASWPDEEVARRWCRLFPCRSDADDGGRAHVERLLGNTDRLPTLRRRLGNLSWFMRCLNEPLARRANAEDDCKGRFWEGRFKCQALLDETAVLAAMAYVDLNPIRAGLTTRLDRSKHTSILRRIEDLSHQRVRQRQSLEPIAGRKPAFDLSVSVEGYVELVDWTGRQLRPGKRGAIPKGAPAALSRLGLDSGRWTLQVRGIGSRYWRAVGSVQALLDKAGAMGQRWLKGVRFAQALEHV